MGLVLEGPDRTVKCVGELFPGRLTLWGMTNQARLQRGGPLDQHLCEEMLFRREVVVQRPESDVGFLGHVLDLYALVLVSLQERQAGVDDALAACPLLFGQYLRRYRFCHLSPSYAATPSSGESSNH